MTTKMTNQQKIDRIAERAANERNIEGRIAHIAKQHLNLETLETAMSSADFSEQAVWNLKKALRAAYDAGMSQGLFHQTGSR